ncbi:MAG: hypothetical protein EXS44_02600 [Candidatus Levybacteria bacterium]|nr:hypothetical protein [Candidatus Levybacteria bacterium]
MGERESIIPKKRWSGEGFSFQRTGYGPHGQLVTEVIDTKNGIVRVREDFITAIRTSIRLEKETDKSQESIDFRKTQENNDVPQIIEAITPLYLNGLMDASLLKNNSIKILLDRNNMPELDNLEILIGNGEPRIKRGKIVGIMSQNPTIELVYGERGLLSFSTNLINAKNNPIIKDRESNKNWTDDVKDLVDIIKSSKDEYLELVRDLNRKDLVYEIDKKFKVVNFTVSQMVDIAQESVGKLFKNFSKNDVKSIDLYFFKIGLLDAVMIDFVKIASMGYDKQSLALNIDTDSLIKKVIKNQLKDMMFIYNEERREKREMKLDLGEFGKDSYNWKLSIVKNGIMEKVKKTPPLVVGEGSRSYGEIDLMGISFGVKKVDGLVAVNRQSVYPVGKWLAAFPVDNVNLNNAREIIKDSRTNALNLNMIMDIHFRMPGPYVSIKELESF